MFSSTPSPRPGSRLQPARLCVLLWCVVALTSTVAGFDLTYNGCGPVAGATYSTPGSVTFNACNGGTAIVLDGSSVVDIVMDAPQDARLEVTGTTLRRIVVNGTATGFLHVVARRSTFNLTEASGDLRSAVYLMTSIPTGSFVIEDSVITGTVKTYGEAVMNFQQVPTPTTDHVLTDTAVNVTNTSVTLRHDGTTFSGGDLIAFTSVKLSGDSSLTVRDSSMTFTCDVPGATEATVAFDSSYPTSTASKIVLDGVKATIHTKRAFFVQLQSSERVVVRNATVDLKFSEDGRARPFDGNTAANVEVVDSTFTVRPLPTVQAATSAQSVGFLWGRIDTLVVTRCTVNMILSAPVGVLFVYAFGGNADAAVTLEDSNVTLQGSSGPVDFIKYENVLGDVRGPVTLRGSTVELIAAGSKREPFDVTFLNQVNFNGATEQWYPGAITLEQSTVRMLHKSAGIRNFRMLPTFVKGLVNVTESTIDINTFEGDTNLVTVMTGNVKGNSVLVRNSSVSVAAGNSTTACYGFSFDIESSGSSREHNFGGSTVEVSCGGGASVTAIAYAARSEFAGAIAVRVADAKISAHSRSGAHAIGFEYGRFLFFASSAINCILDAHRLSANATCNASSVANCSSTAVWFAEGGNVAAGQAIDFTDSRLYAAGANGVHGVYLQRIYAASDGVILDRAVIEVEGGKDVIGVRSSIEFSARLVAIGTNITAVARVLPSLDHASATCIMFDTGLPSGTSVDVRDAWLTAEVRTLTAVGVPLAFPVQIRTQFATAAFVVRRSTITARIGDGDGNVGSAGFASGLFVILPPGTTLFEASVRLLENTSVTVTAPNATGLMFVEQDPQFAPAVNYTAADASRFVCDDSRITVTALDVVTAMWLPGLRATSTLQLVSGCMVHARTGSSFLSGGTSTAFLGEPNTTRGVLLPLVNDSTVVIEGQSEVAVFGAAGFHESVHQEVAPLVVTGDIYNSSVDIRGSSSVHVADCDETAVIDPTRSLKSMAAFSVGGNVDLSRIAITDGATLGISCHFSQNTNVTDNKRLYAVPLLFSPTGVFTALRSTTIVVEDATIFSNMTVPQTTVIVRWLILLPNVLDTEGGVPSTAVSRVENANVSITRSTLLQTTSAAQPRTFSTVGMILTRAEMRGLQLSVAHSNMSVVGPTGRTTNVVGAVHFLVITGSQSRPRSRCNITFDSNFGTVMKPWPISTPLFSFAIGPATLNDTALTVKDNVWELQSGTDGQIVSTPNDMENVTIAFAGNKISTYPATRGASTPRWPGMEWINPLRDGTRLYGSNTFSSTCDKYDGRTVTSVAKLINVTEYAGVPPTVEVTPCTGTATWTSTYSSSRSWSISGGTQSSSRSSLTLTAPPTESATASATLSTTASATATNTWSVAATPSTTASGSQTMTATSSVPPTSTVTIVPPPTPTGTPSPLPTLTSTPTATPTFTATAPTSSVSKSVSGRTLTPSGGTFTGTPSFPGSVTAQMTPSVTATTSHTVTRTITTSLSRSRSPGPTGTLTLILPPPPREQEEVVEAAQITVTTSTAVSSAIGSPVTAVQASRANLMVSLQTCEIEFDEELDSMTSPTGYALGDTPIRYYAGGALMNPVIVFAFFGVGLVLALGRRLFLESQYRGMLARRAIRASGGSQPLLLAGSPTSGGAAADQEEDEHFRVGRSLKGCLSWARCPNFQMFPVLFLLQSTATCAVTVLRYSTFAGHETEHIVAIVALVLTSLCVVWILYAVIFQLPRSARYVVTPSVVSETKGFVGRGLLRRAWDWLTYEDGEWVDRLGSEKFVNQFGSFFDEFIGKAAWFMGVELIFSYVLGLLAPIATGDGCFPVALTTVVAYLIYVVILFAKRPHTARLNFIFALSMASIQLLTGIVVTAVTYTQARYEKTRSAIDYMASFGMFLAVLKTIYDTIMFAHRRFKNIRRTAGEEQELIAASNAPVNGGAVRNLVEQLDAVDMAYIEAAPRPDEDEGNSNAGDDPFAVGGGGDGAPHQPTQVFDVGDGGRISGNENHGNATAGGMVGPSAVDDGVADDEGDDLAALLEGPVDVANVNHVDAFEIGGGGSMPRMQRAASQFTAATNDSFTNSAGDAAAEVEAALVPDASDPFAALLANVDRRKKTNARAAAVTASDTAEAADLAATRLAAISAVFGSRTIASMSSPNAEVGDERSADGGDDHHRQHQGGGAAATVGAGNGASSPGAALRAEPTLDESLDALLARSTMRSSGAHDGPSAAGVNTTTTTAAESAADPLDLDFDDL